MRGDESDGMALRVVGDHLAIVVQSSGSYTTLTDVEPLQIVPESDDPSLPALTFRVFVLGSILCVFGGEPRSSLSTLSADPRRPSCHFPALLLQVQRSIFQQLLHHPHGIPSQVLSPNLRTGLALIV